MKIAYAGEAGAFGEEAARMLPDAGAPRSTWRTRHREEPI